MVSKNVEALLKQRGFAFERVVCSDYGCPQLRKRIIAAPGPLLEHLKQLQSQIDSVTPAKVLVGTLKLPSGALIKIGSAALIVPHHATMTSPPSAGLVTHPTPFTPQGTDNTPCTPYYDRRAKRYRRNRPIRPTENTRSVNEPTYTVTGKGLKLLLKCGGVVRMPFECLVALQGFERGYFQSVPVTRAIRLNGDAVPVQMASAIMRAAACVIAGPGGWGARPTF